MIREWISMSSLSIMFFLFKVVLFRRLVNLSELTCGSSEGALLVAAVVVVPAVLFRFGISRSRFGSRPRCSRVDPFFRGPMFSDISAS
jgi:hypothetical protein